MRQTRGGSAARPQSGEGRCAAANRRHTEHGLMKVARTGYDEVGTRVGLLSFDDKDAAVICGPPRPPGGVGSFEHQYARAIRRVGMPPNTGATGASCGNRAE